MVLVKYYQAINLRYYMKIKEIMETTSAGGIAVVSSPLGEPIKRNPSIYANSINKSKKKKKGKKK